MDDWTRLYVETEISRAGYERPRLVATATSLDADVVAFEAVHQGATALIAFGFETLDSGERMRTGAAVLPYPNDDKQHSVSSRDPWLVLGGWSDLNPEQHVIVGRLRNASATTCRAVSAVGTAFLPVRNGVVVGWVESGRQILYEVV